MPSLPVLHAERDGCINPMSEAPRTEGALIMAFIPANASVYGPIFDWQRKDRVSVCQFKIGEQSVKCSHQWHERGYMQVLPEGWRHVTDLERAEFRYNQRFSLTGVKAKTIDDVNAHIEAEERLYVEAMRAAEITKGFCKCAECGLIVQDHTPGYCPRCSAVDLKPLLTIPRRSL